MRRPRFDDDAVVLLTGRHALAFALRGLITANCANAQRIDAPGGVARSESARIHGAAGRKRA